MPACGKPDDRKFVRPEVPLIRLAADEFHGLFIVLHWVRPVFEGPGRVPEHKGLVTGLGKGQRHRLGLALRAVVVPAARKDQNGRPPFGQFVIFSAGSLQDSRQGHPAFFVQRQRKQIHNDAPFRSPSYAKYEKNATSPQCQYRMTNRFKMFPMYQKPQQVCYTNIGKEE